MFDNINLAFILQHKLQIIGVAIGTLVFLWLAFKSAKRRTPYYPFNSVPLMTRPEMVLFKKLKKALEPDYLIFAQVQASRAFRVKKGFNEQYWFNRMNRLSFDFLICDLNSNPLAVIELDDSSHDNKFNRRTDLKKDGLVKSGKVKMFRWRIRSIPFNIREVLGLK